MFNGADTIFGTFDKEALLASKMVWRFQLSI